MSDLVRCISRAEEFAAAHRLWSGSLSEAENVALFGPCARPAGHGHNYRLEVTVCGPINPSTGMVMSLRDLKAIIHTEVISKVDHRNLNVDSEMCFGIIPTCENLADRIFQVLYAPLGALLTSVRLFETPRNWATVSRAAWGGADIRPRTSETSLSDLDRQP